MIKIDKVFIKEIRKGVEAGMISERTRDNLSIFNYTPECAQEGMWNPHTRVSRGLIWDNDSDIVIARPWEKFFNLDGFCGPRLADIRTDAPFYTLTKYDGSLGIAYRHKGEIAIATRGSFESEQAQWATRFIKYMPSLDRYYTPKMTLLFEIIYPDNRIVVNYRGWSGLMLLGVLDTETGKEYGLDVLKEWSSLINCAPAQSHKFVSLREAAATCKKFTHNDEGFVITFEDGLKVKIKSDEYMRIQHLLMHLGPISLWESLKTNGVIPIDELDELPVDLQNKAFKDKGKIEDIYTSKYIHAVNAFHKLDLPAKSCLYERKAVAARIKDEYPDIQHELFSLLDVHSIILKKIYPKGNEIVK